MLAGHQLSTLHAGTHSQHRAKCWGSPGAFRLPAFKYHHPFFASAHVISQPLARIWKESPLSGDSARCDKLFHVFMKKKSHKKRIFAKPSCASQADFQACTGKKVKHSVIQVSSTYSNKTYEVSRSSCCLCFANVTVF